MAKAVYVLSPVYDKKRMCEYIGSEATWQSLDESIKDMSLVSFISVHINSSFLGGK